MGRAVRSRKVDTENKEQNGTNGVNGRLRRNSAPMNVTDDPSTSTPEIVRNAEETPVQKDKDIPKRTVVQPKRRKSISAIRKPSASVRRMSIHSSLNTTIS